MLDDCCSPQSLSIISPQSTKQSTKKARKAAREQQLCQLGSQGKMATSCLFDEIKAKILYDHMDLATKDTIFTTDDRKKKHEVTCGK